MVIAFFLHLKDNALGSFNIKHMRCIVSKEEVLKKLQEVQEVKKKVVNRVWSNALLVREIDESKSDQKGVALSKDAIVERSKLVAEQFIKDHHNSHPVVISLMDGAAQFASLLLAAFNQYDYPHTPTSMQASSYGNETTAGKLKVGSMPKTLVGGKTVLLVDDVCDSGATLSKIKELLLEYGADAVYSIVLVDKVQERSNQYSPDYVGFNVPADAFIVGMGLDYYGELRNKSEIRAVDTAFLPTEEERLILDSEAALNEELRKYIALEKTTKPSASIYTTFGSSSRQQVPDALSKPLVSDVEQQQNTTSFYH